jgi:predicted Zn-dependent protease
MVARKSERISYLSAVSSFLFGFSIGLSIDYESPSGRIRLISISEQHEGLLGRKARLAYLRDKELLPENHELSTAMQSVLDRLLSNSRFKVFIVNDGQINAISFPDGSILVHTGIFTVCENTDEAACVLAHECAHILLRHSAELHSITEFSLWPLGIALSWIIASGFFVTVPWLGKLEEWIFIKGIFNQTLETEADRIGLDLLISSGLGGTTEDILAFWRNFLTLSRGSPPNFGSHPPTEIRLRKIEEYLKMKNPIRTKTSSSVSHEDIVKVYHKRISKKSLEY